ncbi:hypothetical protein RB195_012052 [Necator americanus]|uniref:Reverse transcriptase domain-containing protein n=1 Tax=Necator americanus TaxID=51031 RepID=A0ABR1D5A7_NECAM
MMSFHNFFFGIHYVSGEYKIPLCFTFVDLKKLFDSAETKAVMEALDNQDVNAQCLHHLRIWWRHRCDNI